MRMIRSKSEKEIIKRILANFIIVRDLIYSSNLDVRQECECIDQLVSNIFDVLSIFDAENLMQPYLSLYPCIEDNIGRNRVCK